MTAAAAAGVADTWLLGIAWGATAGWFGLAADAKGGLAPGPGVIGVAGVGGSASCVFSVAGVTPALRFAADFF